MSKFNYLSGEPETLMMPNLMGRWALIFPITYIRARGDYVSRVSFKSIELTHTPDGSILKFPEYSSRHGLHIRTGSDVNLKDMVVKINIENSISRECSIVEGIVFETGFRKMRHDYAFMRTHHLSNRSCDAGNSQDWLERKS